MGEWIEHDGKGCPVAGNTIVQTRLQLFPKLIGDPVFADACSGWLHQPGEGLYISHYRIVGPQQEQAHMMAAPANLSGQGMLDNSIIAERDALRAEVERLTNELAMARSAKHSWQKMTDEAHVMLNGAIAEIERLRKGRDDVRRNEVGSDSVGSNIRSGSGRTCGSLLMETGPGNLDPRLGMPQPEGEPVGPRPMRRWVPIL